VRIEAPRTNKHGAGAVCEQSGFNHDELCRPAAGSGPTKSQKEGKLETSPRGYKPDREEDVTTLPYSCLQAD